MIMSYIIRVRRHFGQQLKQSKLKRNFSYFKGMRNKLLTQAQGVIREYWLQYRENKRFFKKPTVAKQVQQTI